MKFSSVLLIVLISVSVSVDALWSSKCKESETSTDKVVRLIQNANCTLQEKQKQLHESLKYFRDGMKVTMQTLKGYFWNKGMTTNGTEDGLDYAIDVRMLKDSDASEEEEEEETTIIARLKRDEEDGEETENDVNNEESEDEHTTVGHVGLSIIVAPTKCRPGQKFANGRCRPIV